MIDEVRMSDLDYAVHQVEFSRGSSWLIKSEDLLYRWRPFEEQQHVP